MIYGWMIIFRKNYIPVYYDNQEYTLEIKPFDRSRDGKGPGDMGYKRMKKYLQIRFLNGF
jgi:hypothetical protein